MVGGERFGWFRVGWVSLPLAHVGAKENEFIHLLGGYLLPPLHGQALLAHSHTLAAYAHGGHGEQPQRQASEPGELLANGRAPVLEEVRCALEERLGQVLKNLLSDLALTVIATGH